MNLNQIEKTIYENIDSYNFDNFNLSKLICGYVNLTPLQKLWSKFCIEKSLPNISDYNDYLIINGLINPDNDSVFQGIRKPDEFYEYFENDNELINYILPFIEEKIDFTYFNASLLIAIFGEECLDDESFEYENNYDNFDNSDDEKYEIAIKNSYIFQFLLNQVFNCKLVDLKSFLLNKIIQKESNNNIDLNVFNNIWERIFDEPYDNLY